MTALNDFQRQAIRSGFRDVHRRLEEMEAMLAQSGIDSPFARFVNDLSPTERQVMEDYFRRIREAMQACLREAGIPLEIERTSLRWAVRGGLIFLESAVAEFAAERLRGYGELSAEGRAQAERIQHELRRWIERAGVYLRQGLGRDLGQRLARLDAASADAKQLEALDRIVTRRGLVEFRPRLDEIVRRLEAPRFEIAVFGRVSSGKSSLLNHIAGRDVLPVGVVPITAVPTRLTRGERALAMVAFAERESRTVAVEELRAYASEEGNPANRKHVTAIDVYAPSLRLREGVVLVDTPGIGSLARAGSAETFAYLPRCDLGVVLIDAASTINADDLTLLRLLAEAGVPVQVLLSKADLLTSDQRRQAAEYIREQIQRELGLDVAVHPVSIVGADEAILDQWFEREIEPLLARSRALAEQSLRRKLAHLRESVTAVLDMLRWRSRKTMPNGHSTIDAASARRWLDEADEAIRRARHRCRDWTMDLPQLRGDLLSRAAKAVVAADGFIRDGRDEDAVAVVLHRALTQRSQTARAIVTELQQRLIHTLNSLQQILPMRGADEAPVRDFCCQALPPVDVRLPRDAAVRARPWWSRLLLSAAEWEARRKLAQNLGPLLNEQLEVYDRQVQAWLRSSLEQLAGLYEAQADMFREQARRMTHDSAEAPPDEQALEADLRELRAADPQVSGVRPV